MRERGISLAFRLVTYLFCITLTVSMTINWVLHYSLNEDLSRIKFKHYHDTEEDVYPDLSLCLGNSFEKQKLSQLDPPMSDANLVGVLKGEEYNDQLLTLNYSNIIFNLDDFTKTYWFRWQNGSTKKYTKESLGESLFYNSFTGFWRKKFFNCFGIQVPEIILQKQPKVYVEGFGVHLNATLFPQGLRPDYGKFATFLHYPNQILLAIPTVKYKFQKRSNELAYNMKYIINGLDTLKRRQKSEDPCHDNWKNFDNDVIEMNIRNVGCKNIYHKNPTDWPICNNRTYIRKANFPFRSDILKKYNPPCRQVDKMHYVYEEMDYPDEPGTFWVTILLLDSRYTEIVQTRYN